MIAPFPLRWPDHVRRAPRRRPSRFGELSFGRERALLFAQVELLGGNADIVITTNIPLRSDGQPMAGVPRPSDPGVAVYWTELRHAQPPRHRAVACDAWLSVVENMHALMLDLQAERGRARWRCSGLIDLAELPEAAPPAEETTSP